MVLPSGFALPPLPYLVALLVADAVVIGLLLRRRPPVTWPIVLGFVPWIVVGSALHAVYQTDAAPAALLPLLGTPAVYVSTFAVAGTVWLVADVRSRADSARVLGAVGLIAFVLAVSLLFASAPEISPVWPLVSLVVAGALSAGTWAGLRRVDPGAVAATGGLGAMAVFGHLLDGVSTAVGVDVLGFGERTPASRAVMDVAATLPTAEVIGVGWLFVLVKLAVVSVVVHLFAGYTEEEPHEAALLLGAIAAVGLGPGVHNLLLYAVR